MTRIDFVGRKYIWFALSAAVIVIGVVGILLRGLTLGIEFKGGTLLDVRFRSVISVEAVRKALAPDKMGDAQIQMVGVEEKEALIRTVKLSQGQVTKVEQDLRAIGASDLSVQTVGGTWGKQLTYGVSVAIIVALLVVLSFVAYRFEFKMGIAGVIALVHDIVIALGLYAFLGREVTTSTVAAFLTILGYSLYDTIVVFDRVRENASGLKKQPYSSMVNESINQTLRRSISTTFTSVVPVAALFFFGGETLKDFAFALMVGLISGAYSSIFIASPILAMWKETEPRYVALRRKLEKAG